MKALKIIGLVLLLLLGAAAVTAVVKRDAIARLSTVNTLFDTDRIVDNFSNMDRAFLTRTLEAPQADDLSGESRDLPEVLTLEGRDYDVEALLAELDTTALVILRDGEIIHESYYRGTDADDRRISWSVAKSFLSGLYGNAVQSGAVESLEDDVTVYVPELRGTAYEGASVRNVLNMASGVRFDENYMDPDSDINRMGRIIALGGSLDDFTRGLTERAFEPGTDWSYNSMDTHVAAWVLRKATGRSIHDLWEETYGPLGFRQPPYYLTDGEGVAFALGGLNLTARDYAKFGQLFLQRGMWEGEALIPDTWVQASTRHSAPVVGDRGVGYGLQWWVPMPEQGDFFAVGIYGQYVYIDPSTDLVIAKTAADREFAQADEFGVHSMSKNIALMRGLRDALSEDTAPVDVDQ